MRDKKPKSEEQQKTPVKFPVIDRKLQIAMMKFFLKTSAPRILKSKEKNKT